MQARTTIVAAVAMLLAGASGARAVDITVDGQWITDNSVWDMNPAPDIIVFDNTAPGYTFTTASGCNVQGTLARNIASPSFVSLFSSQPETLVLTNFVADRPVGLPPGPITVDIQFHHLYTTSVPGVVTAADQLSAIAQDGTGAATFGYNSGLAVPLLAGDDQINSWQCNVNSNPIVPPNFIAPVFSGAGTQVAYPVLSDGPQVLSINPGAVTYPDITGNLSFTLGGDRDQFVLPGSIDVGYVPMPEPATLVLLGLGAASLLRSTRRKAA